MGKVLRHVAVAPGSHALHLPPVGSRIDPALAAEAYERGRADGEAQGRAAARAEGDALIRAVIAAFDAGVAELRRRREDDADDVLRLAVAIAERVSGGTLTDDASAVIERIRAALSQIDDTPLEVAVHRDHADAARQALDGRGVAVVDDPALGRGEARVTGRWAAAELTDAAAWAAVRDALGL